MSWTRAAAFILVLTCTAPLAVAQPARQGGITSQYAPSGTGSSERWLWQLESELEHLQEDLHYERGTYPSGLSDQVEQVSRAVTHFHHVLRRNDDPQHLMRDFQEMDQQIHQLVDRMEQSADSWLRRQAERIRYADEQLHYTVQARWGSQSNSRQILARHAHLLEAEAKNLRTLASRLDRRDNGIREATQSFAEEAEHFHRVVEQGANMEHLRDDFRQLDDQWHHVVTRINRSAAGMYLRRTAQNVDRVHNQIHQMLTSGQPGHPPVYGRQQVEERHANPQQGDSYQRTENRQRDESRQDRSAIEVEIPGIGRFRIPR